MRTKKGILDWVFNNTPVFGKSNVKTSFSSLCANKLAVSLTTFAFLNKHCLSTFHEHLSGRHVTKSTAAPTIDPIAPFV